MSKPVNAIPFPRWPLVVIAVAVLAVAGVLVFTRGGSDDDATTGTKIQKTTTSKPASGCLGGPDPAVAVLAAQKDAPHTADGAAAFLATYVRWQLRAPRAGEQAPAVIGAKVWGPDVDEETRASADRSDAGGYQATVKGKHYSIREVRGRRVLVAMTLDIADSTGAVAASAIVFGRVQLTDAGWIFDGIDEDLVNQAAGTDKGAAFRAKLDAEGIPFQESC